MPSGGAREKDPHHVTLLYEQLGASDRQFENVFQKAFSRRNSRWIAECFLAIALFVTIEFGQDSLTTRA